MVNHQLIEEESYLLEVLFSQKDFPFEAKAFLLWFDYERMEKHNQYPFQIPYSLLDSRINLKILRTNI